MSMMARAGTLARKTRRKSGGNAYRFGLRYHSPYYHHHNNRDSRNRRASAPILTPNYPRFFRVPSPISRSAETVAAPNCSRPLHSSPSKSVSFSTELEEVLIPKPDNLPVHMSVGVAVLQCFLPMEIKAVICSHLTDEAITNTHSDSISLPWYAAQDKHMIRKEWGIPIPINNVQGITLIYVRGHARVRDIETVDSLAGNDIVEDKSIRRDRAVLLKAVVS